MSRTDKDRPYWVKANDATLLREPDHGYGHAQGCTLNKPLARGELWRVCANLPVIYPVTDEPPRELIRDAYYGPDRAASRDTLVRMAREFNTFGDVDDTPVQPNQHKHAPYRGGYWD